jgi:hypothetical protein
MSKITDQELAQLKDQESKKEQILREVGILEARKHQFLHALDQVLEEQDKTKIALEDKYGKINVDLKDGSYSEIKEEEAE